MLGNFSKDEKTDPYAVDVMPCKGLNQSNYHGDYTLPDSPSRRVRAQA